MKFYLRFLGEIGEKGSLKIVRNLRVKSQMEKRDGEEVAKEDAGDGMWSWGVYVYIYIYIN